VNNESSFLSVREVAVSLGVSPQRAYQLVRAGEIPNTRLGGAIRIPRAAWDRWLDSQTNRALEAVGR